MAKRRGYKTMKRILDWCEEYLTERQTALSAAQLKGAYITNAQNGVKSMCNSTKLANYLRCDKRFLWELDRGVRVYYLANLKEEE